MTNFSKRFGKSKTKSASRSVDPFAHRATQQGDASKQTNRYLARHCERSEATQVVVRRAGRRSRKLDPRAPRPAPGLLRFARNDGFGHRESLIFGVA